VLADLSTALLEVARRRAAEADRAHQLARLDPGVKDAVERLARALCRRPEIIATCGHALLVARPRSIPCHSW
jgi:hypothetical protein